jgi:hypothetical protein
MYDVMVMKFLSDGAHQWTVLHGSSSIESCYYGGLEAERERFVVGSRRNYCAAS